MKRFVVFLLIQGLASVTCTAQSWNSTLFPNVNGKYESQPVSFAGRTWALEDFSYVGYYLGTRSLGSVPGSVGKITATGDITQAVRSAVDRVGKAGGGSVRIPAGTFTMSASVAIPYNNVSIEGAGSGETTINVPSNYASENGETDALFTFGRTLGASPNSGWIQGPDLTGVSAVIRRGDMQVRVENASRINVGDWIVFQQLFWPALVNKNSTNPHPWPANSCCEFAFTYLRQVTDKSDKQISLDAPIPWTLDPANNPVRIRATDGQMKENVGVKGMTIQFANNTLGPTGKPHGSAALFEGVRNGWVYDVKVFNFPRYGIYLSYSTRITILDCRIQTAQNKSGDGHGYGFLVAPSQNILIKRSHCAECRHNFITSQPR